MQVFKVLLSLVLLSQLSACESQELDQEEGKPIVYTSFYPIYDLSKTIAGDSLNIQSFMPHDKDPHLWEPSPKDMRKLSEADLLIVNGANLERWLNQVQKTLPDLEVLNLSESIDLITYKGAAAMGDFQYMAEISLYPDKKYSIDFGHTHEDIMRVAFYHDTEYLDQDALIEKGKKIMEKKSQLVQQNDTFQVESEEVYGLEMGHESGIIHFQVPQEGRWIFYSDRLSEEILSYELLDFNHEILDRNVLLEGSTSGLDQVTYDPHSWISLKNAKQYAKQIEMRFTEKYPEHKRTFQKNRLKLIEAMTNLEYEYKDRFEELDRKEFVVTHYAYEYLARDFGLRQFPLQGLVSMEAPSLKTMRKAISFCDYHSINTIFYEIGRSEKPAETLALEIDGQAVPLVSMEFVIGEDKGYLGFMRDNLEKIYRALR